MGYKCRDCENFVPIEGTAYGKCKARPFARKQGGQLTDKEFITERCKIACEVDFVKREEELPPIIKTCKQCGKEFVVTGKGKHEFCCSDCRVKWFHEEKMRKRLEARANKKCAMCGGPMTGNGRKYCLSCRGKLSKATIENAKIHKRKALSINEINALALAEHLSYGEYVHKYGL